MEIWSVIASQDFEESNSQTDIIKQFKWFVMHELFPGFFDIRNNCMIAAVTISGDEEDSLLFGRYKCDYSWCCSLNATI